MKITNKTPKQFLLTTICILFGNALLAFLVAAFIIPHGILMGGTTGIGILLNRLNPWFDTAWTVLVMNIVLLLFGLAILGRKFFWTTVASSLLYPLMLAAFQQIPHIAELTDDSTLAAIFAGILMGISLGLVMRVGSSTGGTDVLCLVLHHWFHFPISVMVYVTDIIILAGQAFFSDPPKILLGILVLILEALLLDQTIIIGKSRVQIFAVSDRYDEIRELLLTKLDAGVTMTMIETGRLEKEQKGVLCVIPSRKLHDATALIRSVDPNTFMTVTKIKEVRGRGFTQERAYIRMVEGNGNDPASDNQP